MKYGTLTNRVEMWKVGCEDTATRRLRHGCVFTNRNVPASPHNLSKNLKYLKILYLFCLLVSLGSSVFGQIIIRGKVLLKREGGSIPGVSIHEKWTSIGTLTDVEGHFLLTVSGDTSTIVFQAVGMKSREIPVKSLLATDDLIIKMSLDCIRDWFDNNKIHLGLQSGFLDTPFGGNFRMTSFFWHFWGASRIWYFLSGK